MDRISVVTPTYNRPAPLERALASLMAQRGLQDLSPELIVVDNSADANARELVARLAEKSPFPLHYVSEPRPGVANARNAGAAAAQGRWIAFLDDDEEADPDWLAALARVARERKADAVFRPDRGPRRRGRDRPLRALFRAPCRSALGRRDHRYRGASGHQ